MEYKETKDTTDKLMTFLCEEYGNNRVKDIMKRIGCCEDAIEEYFEGIEEE